MPHELIDRPATPLAQSLERLNALVSPYVGIVRGVEEVLGEPFDIPLHNFCCETAHVGAKQSGAGSGRTRDEARAAAIGEAVERYSACESGAVEAVVASARELGPEAVAPERFALNSANQYARPGFPYAPFDSRTTVAWVDGFSLPDGRPAKLPAQLVYLLWEPRTGEARIASSTSSGLSCHATLEEATLSGLLEVFERDAFMLTWRAQLSWPLLTWPHDGRLERFAERYLRPTGLSVSAVDLSAVWNVPCVLGVARSDLPDEAPLGVGAAAAADVETATEKALDEAVRVRTWAAALRKRDPEGATLVEPDAIVTFEEHIHRYAYPEHAAAADFLDRSTARRASETVTAIDGTPLVRISALCDRLAARGLTAYAADVTSPDVAAAGLRIVKVIVPELCALDAEHAARYLGSSRLLEEPARLGFATRRLREDELNRDPHPFP